MNSKVLIYLWYSEENLSFAGVCGYTVLLVCKVQAGGGLKLTWQCCQSRWALWIKLYIWVISHLRANRGRYPGRACVFGIVCKCVSVCLLDGGQSMPAQPTPSLSFFPSHSPLHFHVYRLSLMVCILTISVWKPTDSPALWAWQGCQFIWEGEVTYYISSHGTSLQYFSLVM